MNPSVEQPEEHPRRYEGADLNPGLIARLALIFIACLALALLMVAGLFHYFDQVYPDRTSEAAPRVSASDLPPLPRLQTNPALDLQQVHAAEDLHLTRYRWIDRAHGIAQIPIDRAMSLWIQTQTTTTAPTPVTTELQMRQDKAKEAPHAP